MWTWYHEDAKYVVQVSKKHMCTTCGKGYSYKHLLNEHTWKEHGEGQHIRWFDHIFLPKPLFFHKRIFLPKTHITSALI